MAVRMTLATYRLQFSANFTFRDAISILDYLRDLGISHVYASPILTSRRGSGHGYDLTDPVKIDPELGGDEGFVALRAALKERDMGLLLDIVPNHMAASSENRWWMDVLEFGADSPFASYFDINWRPPRRDLENKLLLPFLDKPFAEALEDGELCIVCEDGKFLLRHGSQPGDPAFAIAPQSYAQILRQGETAARNGTEADPAAAGEWQGIVAAAESIAADHAYGPQAAAERRARFEALRNRLRQLLTASPRIAARLESTLRNINGTPGDAKSFATLETILAAQHYRLAFWRNVNDTINYRRFFSITDLVGVRIEDSSVFQATHEPIAHIGFDPVRTGFRIDHIDGLRDPRGYLNRLRESLPQAETNANGRYIVVEKILAPGESLPADWPVEGTTGYDYLNFANRLQVDESRAEKLAEVYSRWTGSEAGFDDVLYEKKKLVMRSLLAPEMRSLGADIAELAADDRYAREIDSNALAKALLEITACLPVYRTYIQALNVPDADRETIERAIRDARARAIGVPEEALDFVAEVLLLAGPGHVRSEQREARLAFVTRWQQFTGPIMAKGFEDTALYTYFPLASLNEVGGDPRLQHTDPAAFHKFIVERRANWPHSMNATTTHDTKRSEDTRARIAVLSEIPEEWDAALRAWSSMNEKLLKTVDGSPAPDRNEEYLFYQTLIGAWPLGENDWNQFVSRVEEYMIKATREAKINTRWMRPNQAHESALREFMRGVLDRKTNAGFVAHFEAFEKRIAPYGMVNGLAQTLLKVTVPGVPDCYQGSEWWDCRLVDPDNRGPVDFERRGKMLEQLMHAPRADCACNVPDLLANWRDARVKMHVLAKSLNARRASPDLFSIGEYRPLSSSGEHAGNVIAYARVHECDWAVVVVPRCLASANAPLADGDRQEFWRQTTIALPPNAPSAWFNLFVGKSGTAVATNQAQLSLGDVFDDFPIALLLPAP